MTITHAEFETLQPVRVFSMVGPCLTYYRLVKRNTISCTLAFRNGTGISIEHEPRGRVHPAPCPSCRDHPHSHYPNGYED